MAAVNADNAADQASEREQESPRGPPLHRAAAVTRLILRPLTAELFSLDKA